jgi:hypothetical protein
VAEPLGGLDHPALSATQEAQGDSVRPAVSGDGLVVVFESDARNLPRGRRRR